MLVSIIKIKAVQSILDEAAAKVEDLIGEPVKVVIADQSAEVTLDDIIHIACTVLYIPYKEFVSKIKEARLVEARYIYVYMARRYTKATLKQIGAAMGGRDHTACIHATESVNNLMSVGDIVFRNNLRKVENTIKKIYEQ